MNELELTVGVEPKDEYDKAKQKFIDFVISANKLTPQQQQQLFNELVSAAGATGVIQQIMDIMNNRGYR